MKLIRVLTVLLLGGTLMGSNDALAASPAVKSADKAKASPKRTEDVAVLKTSMGTIVFRFYASDAPRHVANFKKLAGEHFYDGTTFHRVIPGFMIQGGDPNSKDDDRGNDGLGSAGSTIPAEFNAQKHERGTVSMARANDPNSASCQFFICVKPTPFLDGKYSIFGQVVEGQDVVDKIVAVPRDARDNPLDKVVMEKVTIEKRKL
jgi:peptidyl-prolyl cis-trans isomerase B (cyclophilin B)